MANQVVISNKSSLTVLPNSESNSSRHIILIAHPGLHALLTSLEGCNDTYSTISVGHMGGNTVKFRQFIDFNIGCGNASAGIVRVILNQETKPILNLMKESDIVILRGYTAEGTSQAFFSISGEMSKLLIYLLQNGT